MNDSYKLIGPVGWRYLKYDHIAENKRVWWLDFDYNDCRYEAYAAIKDHKPCIIAFRICLDDDGHGISYLPPNPTVLTVKELQDAIENSAVSTPSTL